MFTRNAVLFANEAFYRAFASADLAAMDDLWSRESQVTCIHPGWHPLTNREHIMQVWQGVFTQGNQAPVACRAPEVYVMGEAAFVICYEQLPDAMLVATNIFRLENNLWRLVHHQSGPTPIQPEQLPHETLSEAIN